LGSTKGDANLFKQMLWTKLIFFRIFQAERFSLGAHQLQQKVIEHAGHSINLAKVKGKKKDSADKENSKFQRNIMVC
jgi:hypothetical protein